MSPVVISRSRTVRGFTLVEMMVAMALALLVALAALSTLVVGNRGFEAVDAGAQLRSNAHFATDIIERVALQTGFLDVDFAAKATDSSSSAVPPVMGFNNAIFDTSDKTASSTTAWVNGATGSGSDVLVLRYQPAKNDTGATHADGTVKSDGAMVDCSGSTPDRASTGRDDSAISAFFVANDAGTGEPALFCASLNDARTAFNSRQALVTGVENFQVLYGVQAKSPTPNSAFTSTNDSIPYTYLRADQMVVNGSATSAATYANWRLVRSIRIGMVLRGAANTQPDRSSQTFYPFGIAKSAPNGTVGSAFASANDPGTSFTPTPDGRFRDVLTFAIHLDNSLQQ